MRPPTPPETERETEQGNRTTRGGTPRKKQGTTTPDGTPAPSRRRNRRTRHQTVPTPGPSRRRARTRTSECSTSSRARPPFSRRRPSEQARSASEGWPTNDEVRPPGRARSFVDRCHPRDPRSREARRCPVCSSAAAPRERDHRGRGRRLRNRAQCHQRRHDARGRATRRHARLRRTRAESGAVADAHQHQRQPDGPLHAHDDVAARGAARRNVPRRSGDRAPVRRRDTPCNP